MVTYAKWAISRKTANKMGVFNERVERIHLFFVVQCVKEQYFT